MRRKRLTHRQQMRQMINSIFRWAEGHQASVALIGAIATWAAVIVALFLPNYIQSQKNLDDLIAYRTLAFVADRFTQSTMNAALTDYWYPKDAREFSATEESLKAIRFNNVTPPELIPFFIEIWAMNKWAEEIVHQQVAERDTVMEVKSRSKSGLSVIDDYLRKQHVEFDVFGRRLTWTW